MFTFDSGNSVGEITGHSKSINSVAVRQGRPMKIATGSEDFTAVFHEGPPFKFKCTKSVRHLGVVVWYHDSVRHVLKKTATVMDMLSPGF